MRTLPDAISDEQLLAFLDEWAAHLEKEDYEAAFDYTDHVSETHWTPQRIREFIKFYGKVTVQGISTDIRQRKNITKYPVKEDGYFGYIWYDLNIDGKASDLTATFDLYKVKDGIFSTPR
jgi:hypothetical protein